MKHLFLVILFTLAAFSLASKVPALLVPAFPEDVESSARIIDGQPAVHGQFPWQASIFFFLSTGRFFCGGALIHPQWILTAAHCIVGALNFTISVGSITTNSEEIGRVTLYTVEYIAHENYNTQNLNNDIGLIDLGIEIGSNNRIQTIALPKRGNIVGANEPVEVSGFGRVSDQSTGVSPVLNYVRLVTISNLQCSFSYGTSVVIDSTLCAVGFPHHSTCHGDSGGPLIQRHADGSATHIGVVSFVSNRGCASGSPSGYVRTEAFLDWISQNTGISFPIDV